MMLGIQKSVKNACFELLTRPAAEDFSFVSKFSLVPQIKGEKTRDKVCQFKDFAPSIFERIRKLFLIEKNCYLKSLGVERIMASLLQCEFSSLVGLVSSGKSGSFFYFSDDGKYVLKTINAYEFEFFFKVLPSYYNYIQLEPNTLIQKFFGFHYIKYFKDSQKITENFVVMENLFSTGHEIHLRFDLKGSKVGRMTNPEEDYSVARKDLDFNRANIKVRLTPWNKKTLLEQIEKDCKFFEELRIIDYSLLLGIHHLNEEYIEENFVGKHIYLSADKQYLYFIGIIDVLTFYNFRKKFEKMVKAPFLGDDISCIPPKQYSERFLSYIKTIFE